MEPGQRIGLLTELRCSATQAENSGASSALHVEVLLVPPRGKQAEGRGLSVPLVQLFYLCDHAPGQQFDTEADFCIDAGVAMLLITARKQTVLIYPSLLGMPLVAM